MKEHLAREKHQKETCLYCGRSMDQRQWNTMHHREVLYKVTHCECGKKAMIRMNFYGSGHDTWGNNLISDRLKNEHKTKLRTLESKLKLVGEK
ncbi:MAG: hypothetical protein V1837_07870 [Candidatus Woesearchaeota archaeon]